MVIIKTGLGTAILATDSEPLAIGLTALLLSIPPIQAVDCVTSLDQLLHEVADQQPALILLDTAIAGRQLSRTSETLRRLSPDSLKVILSASPEEYRELIVTSEDPVVIKGTDPARLARLLEFLLKERVVA